MENIKKERNWLVSVQIMDTVEVMRMTTAEMNELAEYAQETENITVIEFVYRADEFAQLAS